MKRGYIKKDDVLNSKIGKCFISPNNKEYSFDYRKEGRKYIYIIIYMGFRMQISESYYNRTNIDILLNSMENSINI